MKNTELLNKLEAIKKNFDMDRLDDLIIKVKQDIYIENLNGRQQASTAKKRTSAANKVLKNKYAKSRPALGYSDIQTINGAAYQVFTDSYLCLALVDPLELPNAKDAGYDYPDIAALFKGVGSEQINLNIPDILAQLKAGMLKEENGNVYTHENGLRFDADKFKIITDIIGTDDLDIYINGLLRPIYFRNKEGDMALLSPIRPKKL